MTDERKEIIDTVKAWAFPILLGIISFFLKGFYDQQKETYLLTKANHDSMMIFINKIDFIEYRISHLEMSNSGLSKDLQSTQGDVNRIYTEYLPYVKYDFKRTQLKR